MKKRLAAVGLAGGLLAGGAAGLAFTGTGLTGAAAQDETTTTTTAPQAGSGGTTAPAPADKAQRLAAILQPLVDDGTITKEQMDKVVAALQNAGWGKGGRGGPGFPHGGMGVNLDAAATSLGISADELRMQLRDGKTIAQVAQERNVDVSKVITAIVDAVKQREDAEGRTQAELDERFANLEQRVTDMVNGVRPSGGPGFRDRDHSGPSGSDSSTSSTTTTTTN